MKRLSLLITGLLLTLSAPENAVPAGNSHVYFKTPTIAGSGCPAGSTSVAINPDGSTISILFSSYFAKPGNKSCNIAIPIHVGDGFQVSTMVADFEGYIEGKGELHRSYFFPGNRSRPKKSIVSSKTGDNFTIRDNLIPMSKVWSKCSSNVNMRINSRIRTANKNSFITIDSLDLSKGLVLNLQYRRCSD